MTPDEAMQWQRGGMYRRRIEMHVGRRGWFAWAIEHRQYEDIVLATSGEHDSVLDAICEAAELAGIKISEMCEEQP